MKLSIQNIVDCLVRNRFTFNCDLRSSGALFESVSLNSEGVYQDDVVSVFDYSTQDSRSSDVNIATNYGDIILVRDVEPMEVHNVLVNLFDTFNRWESRMLRLALEKRKLEELGNAAEEVFQGPGFFWGTDGFPWVLTPKYTARSSPLWRKILEGPETPGEILARCCGENAVYPERTVPGLIQLNGGGRLLYCPILRDGKVFAAVVMFQQSKAFLPGDVNYLERFALILEQYMMLHRDIYLLTDYLGQYIRSVISPTGRTLVREEELYRKYPWLEGSALTVMAAAPMVSYDFISSGTLFKLQSGHPPGVCFIADKEKELVALINQSWHSDCGEIRALIRHAFQVPVNIGVSTAFTDREDLECQYRAAKVALSYCDDERPTVYAREIITQELRKQFIKDPALLAYVHPALRILHAYDWRDKTKLLEILGVFVFNECNYAETAKRLHMSRTTLIQRIAQIQTLTGIDFSDYEQFQSILYSFILYEDADLF